MEKLERVVKIPTVKEVQDLVARKYGYKDWHDLLYWKSSSGGFLFPEAIDEVCKTHTCSMIDFIANNYVNEKDGFILIRKSKLLSFKDEVK